MQHLFRRPVLAVAESRPVAALIRRSGLSQGLVRRFIAGETLAEALTAACGIADQGMTVTLDQLGENIATAAEARAAVATYVETLERMSAAHLQPNISVKLTMLGLDLGDDLATSNMRTILETARRVQGFVRIDMESSSYTDRTLAIAEALHDRFPDEIGTVIQSYLRRSAADVERLIAHRMRVRLVKGAYAEPATVAYQGHREVDAAYARLMERLLDAGIYPAIATHDPALIRATRGYALRMGIPSGRYEFQMLFGVRRDAQAALTAEGYRMRVYVPYGSQWYPYFTRRIAERPANAIFVLRQLAGG
jgi:proline dehydrogenase